MTSAEDGAGTVPPCGSADDQPSDCKTITINWSRLHDFVCQENNVDQRLAAILLLDVPLGIRPLFGIQLRVPVSVLNPHGFDIGETYMPSEEPYLR